MAYSTLHDYCVKLRKHDFSRKHYEHNKRKGEKLFFLNLYFDN